MAAILAKRATADEAEAKATAVAVQKNVQIAIDDLVKMGTASDTALAEAERVIREHGLCSCPPDNVPGDICGRCAWLQEHGKGEGGEQD